MPDIFISPDEKKLEEADKSILKEPPSKHTHRIAGHSHNPLTSFSFYPDHVRFVSADSHERIILLLRQHPIVNFRWITLAILMLFTPYVVSFLIDMSLIPGRLQIVGLMFWYLITSAYILEEFLGWFFNVYIITDERVFDVDFVNLVYREISDANIDQIQDVTVRVGSVIRTLLNYGDIVIQTAAEIPQLEFLAVPQPDRVARILRELRVEEEKEKLEGRVR
jgi:uncharacterized membrane protein YdbT with pleckstrin-like domain